MYRDIFEIALAANFTSATTDKHASHRRLLLVVEVNEREDVGQAKHRMQQRPNTVSCAAS